MLEAKAEGTSDPAAAARLLRRAARQWTVAERLARRLEASRRVSAGCATLIAP
jgi:hypothetical protein